MLLNSGKITGLVTDSLNIGLIGWNLIAEANYFFDSFSKRGKNNWSFCDVLAVTNIKHLP